MRNDSAMKNILRITLENHSCFIKTPGMSTIALHNVQSLQAHVQYIMYDEMNVDCIRLTETWLKVEDKVQLLGYLFLRTIRELSVMTTVINFSLI